MKYYSILRIKYLIKKETKKTSAINEKTNADETSIISKFKINKLDIKNEITKIKLSKERKVF